MKSLRKLKNVWYFIQGNIRYSLYYTSWNWLIPLHIREQIEYRIKVMDKGCYGKGQCKMCGCTTTHLQMCNKPCPKPCYPAIMSKEPWKKFKDELGTN